ncbi:uncharacterized protein N7482_002347 [Penicillium canariense]|uniref:BHLH domain-containing protein n=1 Tax=Penicillium canariense TaxID=189055 RepID=A0A9W9IIK7_9EURO|nr:uncharacterized protein N7482_002347 [Penicillium canariense]KAJ5176470.1 hypothetical protein N7482_002347 [Penicillium canariense]
MEHQPAMTWPEQIQENSLITAPGDDEFSNFLEFNMHFADLEGHGPAHAQLQDQQHSLMPPTTTAPDSAMASDPRSHSQYASPMEGLAMDFNGHGSLRYSTPTMTPGFCAQDSSQQQASSGQHYIMELHGNAARYPQRVDDHSEMYDRYSRINEEQVGCPDNHSLPLPHQAWCDSGGSPLTLGDQALYTPLVSPAMTPLESQFRLPEYTIPGEYFTPLTSPALEAQNAHTSNSAYQFHARQVSDVGFIPTSAEVNPLPGSSAPPPPASSAKIAGELASHTGADDAVAAHPGQAHGPQYGRVLQPDEPGVEQAAKQRRLGLPEPLPDSLMPPPAVPLPRRSPAITPQQQSPGTAATPATLMRIQRSQHAQELSDHLMGQAQLEFSDDVMEDISLPEAAAPSLQPRSRISRIDTSMRSTASPVIVAHETASLEPRLTPAAERTPGSAALSPRTIAMPSPSGPIPKRSDPSRSSISSRKRPSISSTHASPQLRPKISPSIQPLMRGGDNLSQDALYLASKSNYQHILDGTLPSGVSYPETLAENLSSKRTNHKLAEQGRRNRINSALKEIESLIPPEFVQLRQAKEAATAGVKPGDKDREKSANQAISKASAVEMAIDYIKALKKTLDDTASKLTAAEAKLAGTSQDNTPTGDAPAAAGAENAITIGTGSNSKGTSPS